MKRISRSNNHETATAASVAAHLYLRNQKRRPRGRRRRSSIKLVLGNKLVEVEKANISVMFKLSSQMLLVSLLYLASSNCHQVSCSSESELGVRYKLDDQQQQQLQTIPAANPSFEAAFQGECGKNNNSNPCEHICLDLHDGTYECSCFYGFALAVDGYSCAALATAVQVDSTSSSTISTTIQPPPQLPVGQVEALIGKPQQQQPPPVNDNRKLATDGIASGDSVRTGNEIGGQKWVSSSFGSQRRGRRRLQSDGDNNSDNDSKPQTSNRRTSKTISADATNKATTNKAGRDKWSPQYDVLGVENSADSDWIQLNDNDDDEDNKQDELSNDDQNDDEQPDKDIRSIMRTNDKLVSRLARIVSESGADESQISDELRLLRLLVGRTMADEAPDASYDLVSSSSHNSDELFDRPRVALNSIREANSSDVGDESDIFISNSPTNEKSSYTTNYYSTSESDTSISAKLNDEPLVSDSSSDNSSSDIVDKLLDSNASDKSDTTKPANTQQQTATDTCKERKRRRYATCAQLPECESGGRCALDAQLGSARCRCPIGRGGYLCQKPVQRATPRFAGHSYLALPMPLEAELRSLRMVFKTTPDDKYLNGGAYLSSADINADDRNAFERKQRLVLYSQRFVLLLNERSVELRYFSDGSARSQVTRVIGSRDVQPNTWTELLITDDDNLLQPEAANLTRVVLVTPQVVQLNTSLNHRQMSNESVTSATAAAAELFVAGLPEALQSSNGSGLGTGTGVPGRQNALPARTGARGKLLEGFRGCISELKLNGRSYNFRSDLNGDALDGYDIDECCDE